MTVVTRTDETPDISVVSPCLSNVVNVGPIAAAVFSEFNKAEASFEIIIIDDVLTDGRRIR